MTTKRNGVRKITHHYKKFFGYGDEGWARLGGRYGKKRSYGHYAGSGNDIDRTRAEKIDDAVRCHEEIE